jgi:hypothetical protein
MRKITRLLQFIVIIILLSFFCLLLLKSNHYDFFVTESTGQHNILLKNTLVITKVKNFDEIETNDIIIANDGNISKFVRIIDIDNENSTFNVVYDDFDLETLEIPQSYYSSSIIFHLNDFDIITNFFNKYKNIFLLLPFFFLYFAYLFSNLSLKYFNDEDLDFDYDNILEEKEEKDMEEKEEVRKREENVYTSSNNESQYQEINVIAQEEQNNNFEL